MDETREQQEEKYPHEPILPWHCKGKRREKGSWYSRSKCSCKSSSESQKKETARGLVGAHMWIVFVLQNENSLGQDPCLISNMLDAECRGIGEFAYGDRRDGLC